MGANHNHNTRNIKLAFFLNLFFTLFEIAGGIYTNSVAIISDALHDLGDCISLGLAWYLEKVSLREADSKYTFGYRRFSLLGALINALVLIIGSVFIIMEVIPRLADPEMPDTKGMLIISIVGIVFNGAAVFQLRHGNSLNQKVMRWHLLEDVLGWIAILVVSIVLMFVELPVLDSILSICILLYVVFNVVRHLVKALKIFLQAVPEDLPIDEIKNQILNIETVNEIKSVQAWTLDGEAHVVNITISIIHKPDINVLRNARMAVQKILKTHNVQFATIEIQFVGEDEIPV